MGSAVGHAQEIVVEQRRRADSVPLGFSLLVTPQLADGLGLPHVHERRRLGLHHHQWDAVDEEHQVGDNHALIFVRIALFVAAPDAELRRDHELVQAAFGVVEVEEPDGVGVPTVGAFHGQRHAIG